MALLTDDDIALLQAPNLAHIGVLNADGTPHVTAVWVDTDGENILFNTAKGRVKYNDLARNPAVAVSVVDKNDDFRTLFVQGTAQLTEDGADEHIDKLAKKYLGVDSYPMRNPAETRVIVRIRPTARLK